MAYMLKLFHQIFGLLLALAMKFLYPLLNGLDFFIIIVVIIKNRLYSRPPQVGLLDVVIDQ